MMLHDVFRLYEDFGTLKEIDPVLRTIFKGDPDTYYLAGRKSRLDPMLGQNSTLKVIRIAKPKDVADLLVDEKKNRGLVVVLDKDQVMAIRPYIKSARKSSMQSTRKWLMLLKPALTNALKLNVQKVQDPANANRFTMRHLDVDKPHRLNTSKREVEEVLAKLFAYAAQIRVNCRLIVIGADEARPAKQRARNAARDEFTPPERRAAGAHIPGMIPHTRAWPEPAMASDAPVIDPKTGLPKVYFDKTAGLGYASSDKAYARKLWLGLRDRLEAYKRSLAAGYASPAEALEQFKRNGFPAKFKIDGHNYEFDGNGSRLDGLLALGLKKGSMQSDVMVVYEINSSEYWDLMRAARDKFRAENPGAEMPDSMRDQLPPNKIKIHFEAQGGSIVPVRYEVGRGLF